MALTARQKSTLRYSDRGVDHLSWPALNKVLMGLTEPQVLAMLEDELEGKRRKTYVVRLHKRYNIMRMRREREEMKNRR